MLPHEFFYHVRPCDNHEHDGPQGDPKGEGPTAAELTLAVAVMLGIMAAAICWMS
jgi:hypothetical protein